MSIYDEEPYNNYYYSQGVQIYFIISGIFATIGNLYIIFLFFYYKKLQQYLCNWLIIYMCITYVLIGIGTTARSFIISIAKEYEIVEFDFYLCTSLISAPVSCGYRVAQIIALMLAFDRFIAIYSPILYNKSNGWNTILLCGLTNLFMFVLLVHIINVGINRDPFDLQRCLIPNSHYYYLIFPPYSGIISIVFIAAYIASLIAFYKHISLAKSHQINTSRHVTKMQKRVFISISIALFSITIFYVIPVILQMLCHYFKITGWIYDFSIFFIHFGTILNGCLKVIIYLVMHQEFQESSHQFMSKFKRKGQNVEEKHHILYKKIHIRVVQGL